MSAITIWHKISLVSPPNFQSSTLLEPFWFTFNMDGTEVKQELTSAGMDHIDIKIEEPLIESELGNYNFMDSDIDIYNLRDPSVKSETPIVKQEMEPVKTDPYCSSHCNKASAPKNTLPTDVRTFIREKLYSYSTVAFGWVLHKDYISFFHFIQEIGVEQVSVRLLQT